MSLEPEQQLVEEYHAAIQSYIFEGQSFWNRITAFVLLNSALLVARSALPAGPADRWTKVGIAMLGLSAVVLWAHTAVRAHYINEFWLAVLRDLEQRLGMGDSGAFLTRNSFLSGQPVRLPLGAELRLPWYARVNVNDSTSFTLTIVFAAVWIVSVVRLF